MAFERQIKEIVGARKSSDKTAQSLYEAKLKALKKDPSVTAESLSQLLAAQQKADEAAKKSLQDAVKTLYADKSQQSLVSNWSAKVPVLLLPLRIETKFINLPGRQHELWVRIYPDDIAVQQHEPMLSEKEFEAGKNYWMNFFDAEKNAGDQESAKSSAWTQLKNIFGANRGVWIAKQSLPTNWSGRGTLTKKEDLVFPAITSFKPAEWTAPPRTQVLPDKFVVTLFKGESKVLEQEGNFVPDTLILGHDPFQGTDAFTKTDFGITFAKEFLWMSDFEEAVKVGMALKVPLSNQVYSDPSKGTIDKIVVLGAYLSADASHSENILGNLLAAHRYTSGLAIVPQGTPTNNTSDASSAYTKNEDPQQKGYYETGTGTPFQNHEECDGNRLAQALAIDPSIIEGTLHDMQKDHEEAVIMNRAMFPATIGYYFDTLLDKLVEDKYVTILRNFFEQHVTGSGPLPAIRIGDQPYGMLVTSDFTKWKNVAGSGDEQSFYNQLLNWLNFFSAQWEAEVKNVLYAGREKDSNNAPLKPEDVFLDIIGLEPSSLRFERRTGFYKDLPLFNTSWANLALYKNQVASNENIVKQKMVETGVTLPNTDLLFTGLLFNADNKVFIPEKNLIDGLPNLETRELKQVQQVGKNYLEWLRDIDVLEDIEKQNFSGASAPNYLLYLLCRHALLLEIRRSALASIRKINPAITASELDKTYLNFADSGATTQRDVTVWEVLYADLSKLNLPSSDADIKTLGQQILKSNPENIKSLKSSFGALSSLPTARLQRLLTGHLDCLTYRLDAWQSGLFYDRLLKNRADVAGKGIYLGAFGYLENFSPAAQTVVPADKLPKNLRPPDGAPVFAAGDNAGMMLAPSLDHAAAAALLMAGYRNNASPQEPGAFAVDLSSARIRRAKQLLEGVRNGQSVEALLGYQFERGCHEKTIVENLNLNQFVLAFRDKYPIENQYNEQEGETVDPGEVFRVVPANVVNGLKIANETDAGAFQNVMQPVVPGMAATELATLVAAAKAEAAKLSDTLDAAKDLLLSESVFQAASGNGARTGAVLDALREGAVPPDPGIIKTPRKSGFGFQQVLSLHFPQGGTVPSSWGDASPRSQFEPGLNAWLAAIIGDPTRITCTASHRASPGSPASPPTKITLSNLSLQPVDFLYECGRDTGATSLSLERRIAYRYRSLLDLPSSQVVDIDLAGKAGAGDRSFVEVMALMKSLFAVMSQSRAIHARDYLPFQSGQPKPDGVDIEELKTRISAGVTQLKAISLALNNAIENDVANIAERRIALAAFDISNAWPLDIPSADADTAAYVEESKNVLNTANVQAANAQSVIDHLDEIEDEEEKTNTLVKLAKVLLGANFPVMPKFTFNNAADIRAALNDNKQLLKYYAGISGLPDAVIADDWLQSVSEVRSRAGQWEHARSLAEISGNTQLTLRPFQLPYRKKDSWLAVEFPKTDEITGEPFGITTDTISCCVVWPEGNNIDGPQSGLLIDEWSEIIPTDTETMGIAFHYNQPDSMPPQALLLAVYPGSEPNWNWDALIGTVTDTFKRAKMRAVEPRHFVNNQLVQHFLPGIIAPINISGNNISLDFAVASDEFLKKVPHDIAIYEAHLQSAIS
jgi:hypothetical protein